MSTPQFPNIWQHRKVAETAAKSCDICLKPSSSVLVTPEKQDFFYVCPVHLKDTRFCKPLIDEEAIAAKRKKEMDAEVERVKKEYEEKQRKKKEKEKEKEKGKEDENAKSKDKEKDTKAGDDKKDDTKAKDEPKPEVVTPVEEEPRLFALQKNFYQQRIDKKRQIEIAKRNRERLNNPNFFPSVPKGTP